LALALQHFEGGALNSNINSYVDAFWTLQMSASTIGFGDHFPVTIGGRMVVALMFYVGVGLVGFIGALIAERILGFADTNIKNRELRQQNSDILMHNKELEKKIDLLIERVEQVVDQRHEHD
jgi:voltage-gated potassium channel